ncbi:DUF559 domain-containing protein [Phenylobacterium sp.]|uniref:DUF559 domain-containing protein n=1 Tax=Phenylobacterium sp. TaxID=1871053 RepID=UPI003D2AC434
MAKVVSVTSKFRGDRARRLGRNQTETEARLWGVLRAGRLEDWKWRLQATVGPRSRPGRGTRRRDSCRSGSTMRAAIPTSSGTASRCCASGTPR